MTRFRLIALFLMVTAAMTPMAATDLSPSDSTDSTRAESRDAVTTRGIFADDNPRAGWLERYQESRQGPEQTERIVQVYKVTADGSIDVQNLSGDVRVSAGKGNEIQVEAIKRVRHREAEEGKRLLSALRVEITHVGNRVEVRTMYPNMRGRSMSASVDYTITVPQNGMVNVKTISGDIGVSGVRGEVRADATSGDVSVSGTPNLTLAKTISGDVVARDITATGTLTLSTVSGSVIANGLKGRALEAGSVSGDVQLANIQVERLQAKTVSGNIEFDSPIARGGRYEFGSHSGNVRVMLAGNVPGFELDASTFSGSIRSDFPVTLRSTASATGNNVRGDDRRRNVTGLNRAIRGAYGDASAVLAVRSFSGNVVITKK